MMMFYISLILFLFFVIIETRASVLTHRITQMGFTAVHLHGAILPRPAFLTDAGEVTDTTQSVLTPTADIVIQVAWVL